MDFAGYFERFVRFVWDRHYAIPEPAYWVALVVIGSLTVFGDTGTADLIGAGLTLLSAVGIARWRVDRRRCRGALLVPRFREGAGTEGHAEEAQRVLLTQLRSKLAPEEADFVQPIPTVVSGDEVDFAVRLRRRLQAGFVLHGRLAARDDGGWSVLPRILEPPESASHMDPFTKDITPAVSNFGPIAYRLPEQQGVRDEEFPFDFARDLEALVRSIAGLVAAFIGDYPRAIDLLEEALAAGGNSNSWLMDALRVSLARAYADNDEAQRGIDLLRPRAEGDEPSPHLLRAFAFLLSRGDDPESTRDDAEAALRRAMEDRGDPLRDQTVHNLMSFLGGSSAEPEDREETDELLQHLLREDTDYRHAWYIKRAVGVDAWLRAQEAQEAGDEAETKRLAAKAAKWYGKALRARPRVQVHGVRLWPPAIIRDRFAPPTNIRANLVDAHGLAGHRLRAAWHEWRFKRTRRRLLKRAHKLFDAWDYLNAYANFDWAIVGRGDLEEVGARVFSATSLWHCDRQDQAEEVWAEAYARDPVALVLRSALAEHLDALGVSDPVPGQEPTDVDAIRRLHPELFTGNAAGTSLPSARKP